MKLILLKKSPIGRSPKLRATVKALGLHKLGRKRRVDETNHALWGMVKRAECLLEIKEVNS